MVFLFISFPATWDKIFALVTGFIVVLIAFKLPPQIRARTPDRIPYVENKTDAPLRPEVSRMNDSIKNDSQSGS